MAELQCLQSVKERFRAPSQIGLEAKSQEAQIKTALSEKRKCGQDLYEIEVIDQVGPKVKVHYVGYDSKYDEWKLREEVVLKQPKIQCTDFHAFTELACQIKRRLLPSRHEDPSVRIQVATTAEDFTQLKSVGISKGNKYTINSYDDLVPILGEKWYIRIVNRNGDFSHVIVSTVEYHMVTPRSLLEYEAKRTEDGTLSFEPVYLEQCYSIVFKFVRGDGNKQQLSEFL